MVVDPRGPDLQFTVYYEGSFFTKVFSIIFGGKVMQPDILHVFENFSNVSLVSLDSNNDVAKIVVKNVAVQDKDGWYVYNGDNAFTSKIDVIEIHNADGQIVTVNNTNKLPAISSKMLALARK